MKWLALFFALVSSTRSTLVSDVNGAFQRTPLLGQTVNLTALVTAKVRNGYKDQQGHNLFLRVPRVSILRGEPVDDKRVSYGLFVYTTSNTTLAQVTPGDIVSLTGKVAEYRPAANPDYLLLTEITSPANIHRLSSNNTFEPIVIGKDRVPPTQFFSPAGFNGSLQPDKYGIDFWQSLQGQLVSIPSPVAINYPNSFSEVWVHGDWPVTGKNSRGGLTMTFGADGTPDANPEAVLLGKPLDGTKNPKVAIGTTLSDIVGVVTYQFGWYYVLPLTAPTVLFQPKF
ncbi:hypothetical protein MIND_00855400 [Mycena indigotica]|uniref:Uncharacterized protein n=1 Tax=Mycena indigotica TaxID=2126181 RepID=A0A8H6W109_9AGAR|nr:uncharacterized protein MIND_00855400 [Mycena indigotica]KAF7299071.1 hypothetical protein MIND_00855400 [Mycena indigotica]